MHGQCFPGEAGHAAGFGPHQTAINPRHPLRSTLNGDIRWKLHGEMYCCFFLIGWLNVVHILLFRRWFNVIRILTFFLAGGGIGMDRAIGQSCG